MSESERNLEIAEDVVVKKRAVFELVKITLIGATALVVAVILVLQTSLLFQQQRFDEVGQDTRARLLDCTEPTGKCYQDGQKRSGAAVKTINDAQKQVVTIAAYCAKEPGNQTLEQIEDCVNKELKR